MKFQELVKDTSLISALQKQKIDTPTPVQADSYKPILDYKNIIARSETGSGKTLAYLIPLFERINPQERVLYSIILVPTQELVIQIHKQVELLAANSGKDIHSVALIGNGNINRQIEQLKSKPQIVVGTSARVLELIKKKKISAHTVKTLVIDEADKMLDKNNLPLLLDVRKCLYRDIQILMYSASFNKKAMETAGQIASDAVILKYNEKETIPSNITHIYVVTTRREKMETLRSICNALKPDKCMIFINTQYDTNEAYQKLLYHHYKIENLSGEQNKLERKNAMERFRTGKSNYLISTDIASRGLHIDDVDTVINVNVPSEPKDYLHRCGRCGRNNKKGICISIVTENELEHIKAYQKAFGINIIKKKLYKGILVKG
ncbi:MAG: DEAD/DEAH box helicase [Thermoflexaceae bacterium]|nr:DEAD/DEAH box helicase [Thermoflexaceae bacterium]